MDNLRVQKLLQRRGIESSLFWIFNLILSANLCVASTFPFSDEETSSEMNIIEGIRQFFMGL